jgi:hypothetical protein
MTAQCVVVRRDLIEETLRSAPRRGKHLLEPLRTLAVEQELPFKVLEDTAISTTPEIHKTKGDLWCCVEGEVEFHYGGELADAVALIGADGIPDPDELRGSSIVGGTTVVLRKGDWLWIPPGHPHAHASAGTARMLIVKIPAAEAPDPYPLRGDELK